MSQFNYCQLAWMCHNCTKNNKINRLHERCLRLIYNDKKSSFEELLEIDSSVSVHDRNLIVLAIEMYKIYHGIFTTILNKIFPLRHQNQYNLRKTSNYGFDSARYLSPKIWEIILTHRKEPDTTGIFKVAIKMETRILSM